MKIEPIRVKVFLFALLIPVVSTQIWDLLMWPEEEDEEIYFDEYEDYNSTDLKILQLSSSDFQNEQDLLEECSEVIVEEVTSLMSDELIERNMKQVQEIITEQTVQLFNVLEQIYNYEDESVEDERKFIFSDIFIWSNVSSERISEILDDYYSNS